VRQFSLFPTPSDAANPITFAFPSQMNVGSSFSPMSLPATSTPQRAPQSSGSSASLIDRYISLERLSQILNIALVSIKKLCKYDEIPYLMIAGTYFF